MTRARTLRLQVFVHPPARVVHRWVLRVASSPDVGRLPSLAVVSGKPAIAYYDETNEDLKYVEAEDQNGDIWLTPIAVDAPAGTSPAVRTCGESLAEVDGKPGIAFYDITNGDLLYVRPLPATVMWTATEP